MYIHTYIGVGKLPSAAGLPHHAAPPHQNPRLRRRFERAGHAKYVSTRSTLLPRPTGPPLRASRAA